MQPRRVRADPFFFLCIVKRTFYVAAGGCDNMNPSPSGCKTQSKGLNHINKCKTKTQMHYCSNNNFWESTYKAAFCNWMRQDYLAIPWNVIHTNMKAGVKICSSTPYLQGRTWKNWFIYFSCLFVWWPRAFLLGFHTICECLYCGDGWIWQT